MPAPEVRPVPAVEPQPPTVPSGTDTAADGGAPAPSRRARPGRAGTWIAIILAVGAVIPAALWWQHQSAYVVSRNAMVRAHISELGTRIAGVVRSVHVDAGSRVKAGDVLLELEDAHLRAELARSNAEHRTLLARLHTERSAIDLDYARLELRIRGAEAELRRATATLAAATSEAENAVADHRALEALLPERAVSRDMVRDAEALAATLKARADAARAEQETRMHALAEAHHGRRELELREQRLDALAGEVERAEAQVARSRADLAAAVIRAPADGAIIRPLAQPGMAVDAGVPAIRMWFSDNTWIEAWVAEESLGDIAPGSSVRVSSPALPGEPLRGQVQAVGLATDYEMPIDYLPKPRDERMRQAPLVGVAIRLDAMPDILRPGMSATASISRTRP